MKKIISLILCTFVICLCCSCSDTSNFSYYKYENNRVDLLFKNNYYIPSTYVIIYGIPTKLYTASNCESILDFVELEKKSTKRYIYTEKQIINRQITFSISSITKYDNTEYEIDCYIYFSIYDKFGAQQYELLAKLDL